MPLSSAAVLTARIIDVALKEKAEHDVTYLLLGALCS